MEMPFTGKEKTIKQNFELFQQMLLKIEIIWKRISQFIRLWNGVNFSEVPCTSEII